MRVTGTAGGLGTRGIVWVRQNGVYSPLKPFLGGCHAIFERCVTPPKNSREGDQ